jgi:hypothetical protein
MAAMGEVKTLTKQTYDYVIGKVKDKAEVRKCAQSGA